MSEILATFTGRGIKLTDDLLEKPFIKWDNLEIKLYPDKIEFDLNNIIFDYPIENIVDIGRKLPKEIIDKSKFFSGTIEIYSTITVLENNEEETTFAFSPETNIYGKKPIETFLRKLFQLLLEDKEVFFKIENDDWKKGTLKFVTEKIKENFIIKYVNKLVVQYNNENYDLFTNIKNLLIVEHNVLGENRPTLEILQKVNGKKRKVYLYMEDKKIKLFLLRYL